jgi:hypothetical protein
MKRLVVLLVGLALALTGCFTRSSGKEFRNLVFTVTGGIAGIDQRLTFTTNGAFHLTEKGRPTKTGRLSADELRTVKELAERVNWPALQEQYVDPEVADAIFDGVSIQLGNTTYKTMAGTGGQPPVELGALLSQLKQVLTDHR